MSRATELEQGLVDAKAALGGRRVELTRGNHSKRQSNLSNDLLRSQSWESPRSRIDCRNYGPPSCLLGIPESREFFAEYLGVDDPANVAVLGNSSLAIMDNIITWSMNVSVYGTPWKYKNFACEDRGYDRHFTIHEKNATGMLRIPLTPAGPDLEVLAHVVSQRNTVGMICVPQHQNPTGITYSRETVEAMAAMEPANPSFQWIFDNAYAHHYLVENPAPPVPIWDIFKKADVLDRLWLVGSLSKVTFPGDAIAAVASSERNLAWLRQRLFAHTIGYPKLPQLRHYEFLPDVQSVQRHMAKHRAILAPKFERLISCLSGVKKLGIATCSRPEGGYFIGLEVMPECADDIVKTCALYGLDLTGAGAPFTYGQNSKGDYLRLAPSCIEEEDWAHIEQVLPASIELATLRRDG